MVQGYFALHCVSFNQVLLFVLIYVVFVIVVVRQDLVTLFQSFQLAHIHLSSLALYIVQGYFVLHKLSFVTVTQYVVQMVVFLVDVTFVCVFELWQWYSQFLSPRLAQLVLQVWHQFESVLQGCAKTDENCKVIINNNNIHKILFII